MNFYCTYLDSNKKLSCQNLATSSEGFCEEHYNLIRWNLRKNCGYVYVLDTGNGIFKIGKAGNVYERIRALTASNVSAKLVFSYYIENAISVERELHKRFEHCKVKRELFNLSELDLKDIEEILKEKNEAWGKLLEFRKEKIKY